MKRRIRRRYRHKELSSQHRKAISEGLKAFYKKATRVKTKLVRTVLPKPARDVMAGAYLYGKSHELRNRGYHSLADKAKKKAIKWAMGNRPENR